MEDSLPKLVLTEVDQALSKHIDSRTGEYEDERGCAAYLAILSQLFCARVRQQLSPTEDVLSGELRTEERVRRTANVFVASMDLPSRCREKLNQDEADRQTYYARRNAQRAFNGDRR